MLQFLYSSTYRTSTKDLESHVEMYALGDEFDLPRLCQVARTRFREDLPSGYRTAEQNVFLKMIPRIYESTPESNRGLRDVAVWYARQNYNTYTRDSLKDMFNGILQSTWPFTDDLLKDLATHPLTGDCPICGPAQVLRATKCICTKCRTSCYC